MKNNHYDLHWDTFHDWGMYRASHNMLEDGVSSLNLYLGEWMENKWNGTELAFNKSKPIGKNEMLQILHIIRHLGGVMGFFPAMQPYIPDEMRQLLVFRTNQKKERAIKNKIREYHADRDRVYHLTHHIDPTSLLASPERTEQLIISDIKNKDPDLFKLTTLNDTPQIVRPEDISKWRDIALSYDFSSHGCEKLIQWKKMEMLPELMQAIFNMIRIIADYGIDQKGYNDQVEQISQNYMAATLLYYKLYYSQDFIKSHTGQILDRNMWQIAEIMEFITYIRTVGAVLRIKPIKTKSGVYIETMKMERTQIDIVNEMVQELSSLPRFIAWSKIIKEENGVQTVEKCKIQTEPLKSSVISLLNGDRLSTCSQENYCQKRTRIEEKIANRQDKWKGKVEVKLSSKLPPSTTTR